MNFDEMRVKHSGIDDAMKKFKDLSKGLNVNQSEMRK